MPKKLSTQVYVVVKATKHAITANEAGVRPVTAFTVDRLTKNRPMTRSNELAVRLNLTIDASLFDKISPIVDIELEEGDLFANVNSQISVESVPDE